MRKPVLGARWLIERGADEARTVWRIDGDIFGRLMLNPHPPETQITGDILVVLDITTHPWRRRLQRAPASPAIARALIADAADEFPFPPESMRYAIGFDGDDAWMCAVSTDAIAGLVDAPAQKLQAVFLAAPGAAGALAALRHYRRHGAATDVLGRAQWLVPRHWFKVAGRMLAVFAALALIAGLLFSDAGPAWLLARQVAGLESDASDTIRRHATLHRMQNAQRAIAELYVRPEARLPDLLSRAFESIPAGHALARIEYRNGMLILGGTGPQAREWLLGLGIPDAAIHIESVGTYTHFRAEFNPEQLRPAAQTPPPTPGTPLNTPDQRP